MKAVKNFAFFYLFLTGLVNCVSGQTNLKTPINKPGVDIIVIDPGHGGMDFGATSGSAYEKDIVLDIALKLGNYISNAFPETKVIYTRDTDIFLPLHRRADIANKNNADLFISIHTNTAPQPHVQGAETFILGRHLNKDHLEIAKKENKVILLEENYTNSYGGFNANFQKSYISSDCINDDHLRNSAFLAGAIQDQFRERAKLNDRSVKQAGFLVLRQINMPGVLIEAGFLSNPDERIYLMSNPGRDYLATSVYLAFKKYKNMVEKENSLHIATKNQL